MSIHIDRRSYFYRIIIIPLTVIIIFLIYNFVSSYIIRNQLISNELNSLGRDMNTSSKSAVKAIDDTLNSMYFITNDYSFDYCLTNSIQNTKYLNEYNECQKYFTYVRNSNEAIDLIMIYDNQKNTFMNSAGTTNKDIFFRNRNLSGIEKLIGDSVFKSSTILYIDSSLYVVQNIFTKDMFRGMIMISFNDYFVKQVRDMIPVMYGDIFVINASRDIVQSSLTDATLPDTGIDYGIIYEHDRGYYLNKKDLIMYQQLAEYPLYYVISIPLSRIYGTAENTLYLSSILIFLVLSIALAFSVILSWRAYTPLHKLSEIAKDFSIATPLSKDNEVKLIEKSFVDSINAKKSTEGLLDRIKPYLLDSILWRIINGQIDMDNLKVAIKLYNMEFAAGYYSVAIVRFDRRDESIDPGDDWYVKVNDLITRYVNVNLYSNLCSSYKQNIIFIFRRPQENIDLHERFSELTEEMRRNCCINTVYVSLSNECVSPLEMYPFYQQALSAFDKRRINEPDNVIVYDRINNDSIQEVYIPLDFEQRFLNCVTNGNADLLLSYLDEIIGTNVSRSITMAQFKQLGLVVMGIINGIALNTNLNCSYDLTERILGSISNESIAILLQGAVKDLLNTYGYRQSDKYRIGKIIQYIEDNLNQDLSIDCIAQKVGLTPNYLCKYFKQNTGETLMHYINNLRIGRAKELLKNTTKNINIIAVEVGYNYSNVFIMNFSKSVGQTPLAWRRSHQG